MKPLPPSRHATVAVGDDAASTSTKRRRHPMQTRSSATVEPRKLRQAQSKIVYKTLPALDEPQLGWLRHSTKTKPTDSETKVMHRVSSQASVVSLTSTTSSSSFSMAEDVPTVMTHDTNHRQDDEYLEKREMSPRQEKWNAITIAPNTLYCIWYLYQHYLRHEHAIPPLTMMAIALGIALHAPFSFLYHWQYAPRLDRQARIQHWSRRMDQVFIHVASTCMSFGTSYSLVWLGLNVLYNGHSIVLQLQPKVVPIRNQLRIAMSMILYTAPILALPEGGVGLFFQCWAVLAFGSWLFAAYPLAGWSHCAFHMVMCFLPPILMKAAERVIVVETMVE